MARVGKPWWWKARNRWAANIDGSRVTAPRSIKKTDRIGAELWYKSQTDAGRPLATGFTVGELVALYIHWMNESGELTINHAHRALFRTLCRTQLGDQVLGLHVATEIQVEHLEAAIRVWSRDGRAPGYQRRLAAQWKAVWAWAYRRVVGRTPIRLLYENSLAGSRNPAGPIVEERFAERKEAAAWLWWLRSQGRTEFALLHRCLIWTGARPSEWTRATWGDIQWDAKPMPVLRREHWKAGKKTGKARRVFIPPFLSRALRRRQAEAESTAPIFSTFRGGAAWTPGNLSNATARLRRQANAAGYNFADTGAERLTCYRWRHTAASTLLMRGVDVATVAELLGTSVMMIQRHYGHLLADHLAEAARRLAGKH